MVRNLDMPGEGGSVGQDVVITYDAVMTDVGKAHQIVAVADDGALHALYAVADVDPFPELVVVADDQRLRPRAAVAEVLGFGTDGGPMAYPVVTPHTGLREDSDVTFEDAALADHRT